jgi:PqqD family protein of HPr-rel-A system
VARWLLSPGVLLEPLGSVWVAFSPASGETHVLNESGAALIQALDASGPRSAQDVIEHLARDAGMAQAEVEGLLALTWSQYLEAGLIRREDASPPPSTRVPPHSAAHR